MSVKILVDFSGIADAIGDGLGICDGVESDEYIGGLINAAHFAASSEFDIDAAASAVPNRMTHMWEYGTVGITRGAPRFSDPTSLASRLYNHHSVGTGRAQTVFFTFRKAVQPNPRPSAEFYGVSSDVISRLSRRKYVFENKASIVEGGETVFIKPKEKKVNFVPFYGKGARNPEYDGQTHIFRPIEGQQPMESTPGDESAMAGKFTAFWIMWWGTKGQNFMSLDVNKNMVKDIIYVLERPGVSSNGQLVPAGYPSKGRIYNRRKRVMRRLKNEARVRGRLTRL